jgi:hypothetical protein
MPISVEIAAVKRFKILAKAEFILVTALRESARMNGCELTIPPQSRIARAAFNSVGVDEETSKFFDMMNH